MLNETKNPKKQGVSITNVGNKAKVKFNGDCLKQEKITFNHGKIVSIYIAYEIERNLNISSYPKLENSFFGAAKLTKHADVDLYKYSRYGIGFNRKGSYSIGDEAGKNMILFGVDMSSSQHIDHKKNNISTLGKGFAQGLEHTLAAEKLYSINFTRENIKFCLSLHHNEANNYLFLNGTEIINFKAKDSENCIISLEFSKHFKRLVSRQYKKEWTKRLRLWF